jgi:hypothetical protein
MMFIIAKYYHVAHIKDERGGIYGTFGGNSDTYRRSVWKSDGKRPLGRPRRKLEDNIEMDVSESGLVGVDGIDLTAQGYDTLL